MKLIYVCDDYECKDSILTIHRPISVGMVRDIEAFNELVSDTKYNDIICPELFIDENGNTPKTVIFLGPI
jgi:actin-related protein